MEAVVFIGIQGSGKSSFYKERFFSTHVRISLDLLKTRHRERRLLEACLGTEQRFVIDNTNPTRAERVRYVEAARAARYSAVGYYFQSKVDDCLRRNSERPGSERVPDVVSQKNDLLFEQGINFNDVPNWQKRGVGLYWEQYDKPALNRVTGEQVTARRRRIKRDFDLPMKDKYGEFIRSILSQPQSQGSS